MKNKKENKNKIQINKGNNNVHNSNTTKTMKNFEMESENRAGKETDRKDNYLHPQFKYRNKQNIYSKNEENYNNKNTEQIGKELKERNVSDNSIRKERRGNEESNDKIYNNTITDLITSTGKHQRGRESSKIIIKNIGIIKRTEREKISSKNNSIASDWKQSLTSSEVNIKTVKNKKKNKITGNRSEMKKTLRNIERLNIKY